MIKKLLILTAVFFLLTIAVSANSAPSYWQGYPLSEVLMYDRQSPVAVSGEQLTFDFTDATQTGDHYWLTGRVKAAYTMTNPTDDTITVQMVFPFVDSFKTLQTAELTVKADDEALSYQLLADYLSYDQRWVVSDLSGLVKEELAGLDWDFTRPAALYQITLVSDRQLYIRLSAQLTDTRIIVFDGLGGFNVSDDNQYAITGRMDESSTIRFLVLGADPVFTAEAFTAADEQTAVTDYRIEQTVTALDGQAYLSAYLDEQGYTSAQLADVQIMNLLRKTLTDTKSVMITSDDLAAVLEQQRIIGMVYEVTFAPQQTKTIEVGYLINGTMDRTATVAAVYRFEYLLSPAQYWAYFANLQVDIYTPEQAPYLTESSLSFTKIEAGHYRYTGADLPDGELSFTLYRYEQISTADYISKKLADWSLYLPAVALIGGIAALTCGAVLVFRLIRRKP